VRYEPGLVLAATTLFVVAVVDAWRLLPRLPTIRPSRRNEDATRAADGG